MWRLPKNSIFSWNSIFSGGASREIHFFGWCLPKNSYFLGWCLPRNSFFRLVPPKEFLFFRLVPFSRAVPPKEFLFSRLVPPKEFHFLVWHLPKTVNQKLDSNTTCYELWISPSLIVAVKMKWVSCASRSCPQINSKIELIIHRAEPMTRDPQRGRINYWRHK